LQLKIAKTLARAPPSQVRGSSSLVLAGNLEVGRALATLHRHFVAPEEVDFLEIVLVALRALDGELSLEGIHILDEQLVHVLALHRQHQVQINHSLLIIESILLIRAPAFGGLY